MRKSDVFTNRSKFSLPEEVFRSMVTERLFRLSDQKLRLRLTSGRSSMKGPIRRACAPAEGSTRITSAPRSPRICPQIMAPSSVRSTTR